MWPWTSFMVVNGSQEFHEVSKMSADHFEELIKESG